MSAVKWKKFWYKFMKSFTGETISFNNLQWQQVAPFHLLCPKPIWIGVKNTLDVSHSQQIFVLPLVMVSVTMTYSLNK